MAEKNIILIVDDQASIIKSLKRLLFSEPYDILFAPDGKTALEIIKEHQDSIKEGKENIFLIISDQRMPNMTGTRFLEQTIALLPDAIRVILSGYADREDILNALSNEVAHRYFTKPWNNEELLLMIQKAFESPENAKKINDVRGVALQMTGANVMDKEMKKIDEHRKDMFLGRVAVHHGFVNQEQLDIAITAMQSERQGGRNVSLENIMFERGLISSEDMGKIVAATRRRMGKNFAKSAMKDFGVSREDIDRCLAIQAQEFSNTTTCRLLDEILVGEKVLTEEQKESIIIDQIYSERDILSSVSDGGVGCKGAVTVGTRDSSDRAGGEVEPVSDSREKGKNDLVLKRRKKNFFRQRALDKIFCKAAIKRKFATEREVLNALEEQMLHFTQTLKIRLVKDILIEHSIISQEQAQSITAAISQVTPPHQPDSTSNAPPVYQSQSAPFDSNDPLQVNISAGELEATIRITGDSFETMTPPELKRMLAERYQIIYGLADEASIEMFIRKAVVNRENVTLAKKDDNSSDKQDDIFVIARGKAAQPGRHALIKYYFKDDNKTFGKELDSGKFDYRERSEIPNVNQGTVLAEKIPLIPAINGITVRGTEITAPVPMDIDIDCGQGVEISADGLRAVAIANGRPDITLSGRISIFPEKIVNGDVDFRTGNIKFSGDIVIKGTILPGFKVIGGNLTVNDIQEAEVNITNTVSVKNNIISSTIRTGLLLTAQIVKKSTIIAQGDVVVQKEVIDSTIITSGMVIVPRGRIIASTIYAAKGIEAMNIGSEVSTPCHLFPGSDEYADRTLIAFDKKIDSHRETLVKLEAAEKHYDDQNLQQLNELSELSMLQERLVRERQKIMEDKMVVSSDIVKRQMDDFLSELDKRALKMDETINRLFDENENLVTKNTDIKVQIKESRTAIQNLLNEKNKFEKWYEDQKRDESGRVPALSVQGTIFAGTEITDSNCSMVVRSNIRNSRVQKVTDTSDPANLFNKLIVIPSSGIL